MYVQILFSAYQHVQKMVVFPVHVLVLNLLTVSRWRCGCHRCSQ